VNAQQFSPDAPGRLVPISGLQGADWAFVPNALPPDWPWPVELWPLLLEAHKAIALLSGIGASLPDPQILLRPLLQREAERSSSLEGTFTPARQQALFQLDPQATQVPSANMDDLRQIANYRNALQSYFESPDPLPLSLRVIRDLHATLLKGVRGAEMDPGNYRRVQVQIGLPPRFVPPPRMVECLYALERYLYQETPYDPLVDAFLAHYQFEAIHPFRDGNGRVGRMLLSIMITERSAMSAPWLHMSAYFDAHRDQYIDHLLRVSTENDWAGWIRFCLNGTVIQAKDTTERCRRLVQLRQQLHDRVAGIRGSSRLSALSDRLFGTPALTIPHVAREFNVTYATAQKDVEKLVGIGVLEPAPERVQPRVYYAPAIFEIISD
jgi:Fic family protein